MSNIIPMQFEERAIPFTEDGWINATAAASKYGKRVKDWLRQDPIKEYLTEVREELSDEKGENSPLLVKVVRGRNGGTWLHPELGVEFARWLSVKFARACDRHIKQLIKQGATFSGHENLLEMLVRNEPIGWERRFPPEYYQALARVTNTRYLGHSNGTPFIFGRITRKWIYGAVMPKDILTEMDARKGESDKLHQWLTDGGIKAIERQIASITLIANTSSSLADFEARCSQLHGGGSQLALIYTAA